MSPSQSPLTINFASASLSRKMVPELLELINVEPSILPPLDPGFRPIALGNRKYRDAVNRYRSSGGQTEQVQIAFERENGLVSRLDLEILPTGGLFDYVTKRYVERAVKFFLWSRGAHTIHFSGPSDLGRCIRAHYGRTGEQSYDIDMMKQAYDDGSGEIPFRIRRCSEKNIPEERESQSGVGGHTDGCRIGFDLGASDIKIALMVDGKVRFASEYHWKRKQPKWRPQDCSDPAEHLKLIKEKIDLGLAELEKINPNRRLDAIGGSSAGIIVNNQVKVASLFRAVTDPEKRQEMRNLFNDLGAYYQVPIKVMNDGDVTALAGALSLGRNAVLGVAMGSSEAAGYVDRDGCIKGWLNELAFAPVDYNPNAVPDEWSKDIGVGARYFSQQAVEVLAPRAGYELPPRKKISLPALLHATQEMANIDEGRALQIFKTIGVYLGYTTAHYSDYYDLDSLLILGRVVSDKGGDVIIETARNVLKKEFPELAERVELIVPTDSRLRRVGQAGAAATLPELA